MSPSTALALQALQIVWINILLSGDNAVVIALACRGLEPRQRRWAILGGSGVAVAMRIALTFFVVELLALPYVELASGLLLLWIAFDLLRSHDDKKVAAAGSTWDAVRTIAVADAVMSLDNVVAVAAAARNSVPLIVFGIAVSVPLIIWGSTLILKLLNRFPLLVVAGAALLGWVAGGIMTSDHVWEALPGDLPPRFELLGSIAGAALILAIAAILGRRRRVRAGDADCRRGPDRPRTPD